MPNWCDNTAKIEGPVDLMYDLAHAIARDEMLSFMAPLPTNEWEYGTAVDVWGTKWDTGSSEGYMEHNIQDGIIEVNFQTAWGPPIQAYDKFLEKHPEVTITASYYESGNNFGGMYEDGEEHHREDMPHSKDSLWETDPVLVELDQHWNIREQMMEWEEENEDAEA
jgi:hypothetical protein